MHLFLFGIVCANGYACVRSELSACVRSELSARDNIRTKVRGGGFHF